MPRPEDLPTTNLQHCYSVSESSDCGWMVFVGHEIEEDTGEFLNVFGEKVEAKPYWSRANMRRH